MPHGAAEGGQQLPIAVFDLAQVSDLLTKGSVAEADVDSLRDGRRQGS